MPEAGFKQMSVARGTKSLLGGERTDVQFGRQVVPRVDLVSAPAAAKRSKSPVFLVAALWLLFVLFDQLFSQSIVVLAAGTGAFFVHDYGTDIAPIIDFVPLSLFDLIDP